MILCSHCLTICRLLWTGALRKVFSVEFSAEFGRVSQRGQLYKLRSIDIGGQFLSILLEFLRERRQRVRFDGKVSVTVDGVLGVPRVAF